MDATYNAHVNAIKCPNELSNMSECLSKHPQWPAKADSPYKAWDMQTALDDKVDISGVLMGNEDSWDRLKKLWQALEHARDAVEWVEKDLAQDKWITLDDEVDMSGVLRGNEDSQNKLKKLQQVLEHIMDAVEKGLPPEAAVKRMTSSVIASKHKPIGAMRMSMSTRWSHKIEI